MPETEKTVFAETEQKGITIHYIEEAASPSSIRERVMTALKGADAVVNALVGSAHNSITNEVLDASIEAGVGVYFPGPFDRYANLHSVYDRQA